MTPASTDGRNASCCAVLKRWISSQNRIVPRPSTLAALLGFANDLAHARHAFGHGAERHERFVRVAREQARERRLAAAGRTPKHHARDRALLDGLAQRLAGPEQLLVAEELVERVGPQPMGERRRGGVARRGRR